MDIRYLDVDQVLHLHLLEVGEGFGPCPKRVDLLRPFVYVIEEMTTGEIMFAGRVDRPGTP